MEHYNTNTEWRVPDAIYTSIPSFIYPDYVERTFDGEISVIWGVKEKATFYFIRLFPNCFSSRSWTTDFICQFCMYQRSEEASRAFGHEGYSAPSSVMNVPLLCVNNVKPIFLSNDIGHQNREKQRLIIVVVNYNNDDNIILFSLDWPDKYEISKMPLPGDPWWTGFRGES